MSDADMSSMNAEMVGLVRTITHAAGFDAVPFLDDAVRAMSESRAEALARCDFLARKLVKQRAAAKASHREAVAEAVAAACAAERERVLSSMEEMMRNGDVKRIIDETCAREVAAEREACAAILVEHARLTKFEDPAYDRLLEAATAIRARGTR